MAITLSNIRKESVGSLWSLSGDFTTADGDSTLTITHGFNYVASDNVSTKTGGVGVQTPKVTHSAGVATLVWDNTKGFSGKFNFVGK